MKNRMVFQGLKYIFQNWLWAAPLCQVNQTYRFIMLDQKDKFFFIKTYLKAVLTNKVFKHFRLAFMTKI